MEPVLRAIVTLGVLVFLAKVFGEFFQFIRLPGLLGELTAGIVFGPFALGSEIIISGEPLVVVNQFVEAFAEIGAIIVLFTAGLEGTITRLRSLGVAAFVIALLGAVVPLLMGSGYFLLLQKPLGEAVFVGAALMATSIAVTARLYESLGKLQTQEGSLIMNAVAIDDVIALAALASLTGLALGALPGPVEVIMIFGQAMILWVILMAVGAFVLPKLIDSTTAMRIEGSVEAAAVAIVFIMSAFSASLGLSPYVGAFSAGMALAESGAIVRVKVFVRHLNLAFGPLFFAVIGSKVDLSLFGGAIPVSLLILTSIAVVSKMIGAGIPAYAFLKNRRKSLNLGIGMIPRGEVGLIIALIALRRGSISSSTYADMVGMVLLTTILAPILLSWLYGRQEIKESAADQNS